MAQSFPILPLAALTTLFLTLIFLIIFYLSATKFFSHSCHQHHLYLLLRRLIFLRPPTPPQPPPDNDTTDEDPFIAFSPSPWRRSRNNNNSRGLHDMDIQHIPTLHFRQELTMVANDAPYNGCVVCLNEFKERDVLRVLPSCGHGFHLDCIDVWLQSNANCPLCRISISGKSPCQNPNLVVAPSSSPQSSSRLSEMGEEDFVVIELGGNSLEEERVRERRREEEIRVSSRNSSSREFGSKFCNANARKQQSPLGMMGDECITVREKNRDDFFFSVQPIRRSFSLDSAADTQQLYSTVQSIIQQNRTDKQIRLFSSRNP